MAAKDSRAETAPCAALPIAFNAPPGMVSVAGHRVDVPGCIIRGAAELDNGLARLIGIAHQLLKRLTLIANGSRSGMLGFAEQSGR